MDQEFDQLTHRSWITKSVTVRTSDVKAPTKRTKVITGHAMVVRDDTKGLQKDHKLYNTKITEKEFGADDKDGREAV